MKTKSARSSGSNQRTPNLNHIPKIHLMKKILTLLILAGAAHLHGAAETANLYETNPTKADELLAALKNDIHRGRSTDGPESANDIDKIVLWKSKTHQ